MNLLKMMRTWMTHLKTILWLVIAAFILAIFSLWGGGADFLKGKKEVGETQSWIAVVDGTMIPASLFEMQYRIYEENIKKMLGSSFQPSFLQGTPTRMVLQMVKEKILSDISKEAGFTASDNEVVTNIRDKVGIKDPEQYNRFLGIYGISANEYESYIRRKVLLEKYYNFVQDAQIVSDKELMEKYHDDKDRANVAYIFIDTSRLSSKAPAPADDDFAKLYSKKNKAELALPEKRALKGFYLNKNIFRGLIEPTEAELQNYFNQHKDDFTTPKDKKRASHILIKFKSPNPSEDEVKAAKAKIDEIYSKAKSGGDFAGLAKKYSEDSSAINGGDLGWFGKGMMVKEFEDEVFTKLTSPGQISEPIRTKFGFHIIKLTDIGGKPRTFDEAKMEVRSALAFKDVNYQTKIDKAFEKGKERVKGIKSEKDIKAIADEWKAKLITYPSIRKDDPVPAIGRDEKAIDAIFKMKAGEIYGPVDVRDGQMFFILSAIEPPHTATVEELKPSLEKEFRKEMALKVARDEAKTLFAKTGDAKAFADAGKAKGFDGNADAAVNRKGGVGPITSDEKIASAVFSASPGDKIGPIETSRGIFLGILKSKTIAKDEDFPKEKDNLLKSIKQNKAQLVLESTVEEKIKELKSKDKLQTNDPLIAKYEPKIPKSPLGNMGNLPFGMR